jgi:acyl-lipid omega-6 desaturase (Delta-12 desaturase)
MQRNVPAITPTEVKSVLREFAKSSLLFPLFLFAFDILLLITAFAGALLLAYGWARLISSVAIGLITGIVFIIGHDACHGSFTRIRWLNEIIGRIAFLPSLHAYSLWHLGHNRIHHRFTNLRTVDYGYPPLSMGEYDGLGLFGKAFERFYRAPFCHGLFYFWSIWRKKMFFPRRADLDRPRGIYMADSCLVAAYIVLLLSFLVWFPTTAAGSHIHWLESVTLGFILPQIVWNWMMGFVTYLHHTDPRVAWFDREEQWDYMTAQVEDTTHIRFPRPLNCLLHYIMEHTAHHAQTGIPLYRLNAAQRKLESHFGNRIVVTDWTLRGYLDAVRRCKLYDYEKHCWLDFSGRRTSSCTLPQAFAPSCNQGLTTSSAVSNRICPGMTPPP